MIELKNLRNIPVTSSVLAGLIGDYKATANKLSRMVKEEILIRLKKDLYVVSPKITGYRISEGLAANHIYNPSYVSMLTALRIYGLIPERVSDIQSMTVKKSWAIRNETGLYTYTHCDSECYPIGITYRVEEDVSFMIATPEKALYDLIAYTAGVNLRFVKEVEQYLIEDMRMDVDGLKEMNTKLLWKEKTIFTERNQIY